MIETMKFKVKDGTVKDCIVKEFNERKYWVTPSKGWLVARIQDNGSLVLANDCEEYVEPVEAPSAPKPDASWTVLKIKEYLDIMGIAYSSSALKADLLALV
jgi:hypothetical protein